MASNVEIKNLRFVQRQLRDFAPRVAAAIMRRTTHRIAAQIRDEIKRAAPKDTGTLKKAVKAVRRRGSRDAVESVVIITRGKAATNDAFYWRFVEYGTKKVPPRPFVAPVYKRFRSTYKRVMKEELKKQIAKEMAKQAKSSSTVAGGGEAA
jgi:HK97 gp10 family phage protein